MTQSFNDFFVGIGNMAEAKILKGKKRFSDFLGNSCPNSIFLKPVDIDEVLKLKPSRACDPNSISYNLFHNH